LRIPTPRNPRPRPRVRSLRIFHSLSGELLARN
jgi:hypothetical protein